MYEFVHAWQRCTHAQDVGPEGTQVTLKSLLAPFRVTHFSDIICRLQKVANHLFWNTHMDFIPQQPTETGYYTHHSSPDACMEVMQLKRIPYYHCDLHCLTFLYPSYTSEACVYVPIRITLNHIMES